MNTTSKSYNYSTGEFELWGIDEEGNFGFVIEQPEKPPLVPPKMELMNFGMGDECTCDQCTRK